MAVRGESVGEVEFRRVPAVDLDSIHCDHASYNKEVSGIHECLCRSPHKKLHFFIQFRRSKSARSTIRYGCKACQASTSSKWSSQNKSLIDGKQNGPPRPTKATLREPSVGEVFPLSAATTHNCLYFSCHLRRGAARPPRRRVR